MDWFKDFLKPEFIWALIGLILLMMEFAAPGLIVFFFGIGAWIVALICLFADISVNTQLVIFLISSIALLLVLRKWIRGIFVGHVYSKQNAGEDLQEFVGHKVLVNNAIIPPQTGSVELNGVDWKAQADCEIQAGKMVEIVGRDNLTLIVKPL
ncbi:MAG: NfeD family protein [Planctomycetes bacterium]|nr:NfeD family protein [Planctomycetota bacterium]